MIEFNQKRGLQSRNFKLFVDKIIVETKTLRKNHKYELKLDRIGHEILYESDSVLVGKIAVFACLVIPPALLILNLTGVVRNIENSSIIANFLIWYFLALIFYLKPHQDDIIIVGGQNNLSFFRHIPNESKVKEYVDLVIDYSKRYLKEKLTKFDSTVPEEMFISRLLWLKDKDILTEIEFQKLKEEINYRKLI